MILPEVEGSEKKAKHRNSEKPYADEKLLPSFTLSFDLGVTMGSLLLRKSLPLELRRLTSLGNVPRSMDGDLIKL